MPMSKFAALRKFSARRMLESFSHSKFALGCALGILLAASLHFFAATLGFSTPLLTGLALSAAICCVMTVPGRQSQPATMSPRLASIVLCGWMLLLPMLVSLFKPALEFLPVSSLEHTATLVAVGTFAGALLFLIPAILARSVFEQSSAAGSSMNVAAGLLLHALVLAPVCGVFGSLISATLLIGVHGLIALRFSPPDLHANDVAQPASAIENASDHFSQLTAATALGLGTGLLVVYAKRAVELLFPYASFVRDGSIAGACLAFALGAWCYKLSQSDSLPRTTKLLSLFGIRNRLTMASVACLGGVLSFVAFPGLVKATLASNATFQFTFGLMSLRLLFAAALTFLPLFCVGIFYASHNSKTHSRWLLTCMPLGVCGGLLSLSLFAMPQLVLWAGIGFIGCAAVLVSLRQKNVGTDAAQPPTSSRWRPVFATAIAGAALICVPMAHSGVSPIQTARLLFSTKVFTAWNRGLAADLLPVVDESRLIKTTETADGPITFWKRRGEQLQLRQNGIPVGVVTLDAGTCPRATAEILPAILPLTLHDNPAKVLSTGVGSGELLNTILAFPIQHVTLVERNSRLLKQMASSETPILKSVIDDQRVNTIATEPALALAARVDEQFDIIISTPPQSTSLLSVAEYTQDFYANAARHLAEDGIFCQRFEQIDFGPEPMKQLVATVSNVFEDVIAIETVPGSMVVLGTNSRWGLLRAGLTDRFQRAHVLTLLTEAGQDWTIVLNQPAFRQTRGDESLVSIEAKQNLAQCGVFAYQLPQEMMRWGNKVQEIQLDLAEHTERLLAWLPADSDTGEIKRRISDVIEQRELISEFPDEPWMYRRTLKSRLERNPRPPLQVVEDGKVKQKLHPITQRRKDYFIALSNAAKKTTPETVDRLAAFAATTDPLVNFFAHHEAADLYRRVDDSAAELAHRLHTIYYAAGDDRSLRNVIRSLELILDNPKLIPDKVARIDEVNGLLQMLLVRWENRHAVAAASSDIALNDIGQTITVVESALNAVEEWQPSGRFKHRRKFLELSLISPLRTYRGNLLKHKHETDLRLAKERAAELRQTAN